MAVGKHVTLAAELEREILSGKYGREGGLPSISELAQNWSMSINTVKSAMALLEGKNLVEKRGIGYYVNRVDTVMTQYVPPTYARLKQGGYCENIGEAKRTQLPKHLADLFNLPQSQQTVYRLQVSGEAIDENKKPMQITHRYYIVSVDDETLQKMHNPNYDPMWDDPTYAGELISHDEVTPRMSTESECDLLNLPGATPITNVLEVIKNEQGELLTVQEIILSPRTTLIFDFPFANKPIK